MKYLHKAGCVFYGIGIAGMGFQQFLYSDFRPVLIPEWPSWIPWLLVWAYLTGGALIVAGLIIVFRKQATKTGLAVGIGFLILFVIFHVTYQLFVSPYSFHLGSWTDPLKELALSGGAFVIARSYEEGGVYKGNSGSRRFTGVLISCGRVFFSIMMIVFGIDHFLYTQFVATLVPTWIPGHIFWTYFAGIALIASGVCIVLKIKLKLVGILLGIMLFLWFVILHIPRAIADPYVDKGNEVTSVFEALAFSGVAFVIAFNYDSKARRLNS